jgi:hypothetical protein
MNMQPLNANVNTPVPPQRPEILKQTDFWLKIVSGWKREIGNVMLKSEQVKASPQITAEVARTAGELSLFAEKLDELYGQIDLHQLNLPAVDQIEEWTQTHLFLSERLNTESRKLRNLLSDMFKLDKAAYKRFLC